MLFLIFKFILAIYILVQAGAWLVKVITKITGYFKVSYFAMALMIMAVATSIPELMVGINSALDKRPELSLGVVLGSNIADLALVFGIVLILTNGITLTSIIAKRDAQYMCLITILPLLLLYDKVISRVDGIILLGAFSLFSYQVFWSKQRFFEEFIENKEEISVKLTNLFKNFILFIFCIFLLLLSSKYVVDYGEQLAINLNIPLVFVGISILAISTSLPELVFEYNAIKSGKKSMALGDIVGSLVANSGLILGITAVIYPIKIENFSNVIIASIYLLILLTFFIYNLKKSLSKTTGYLLITTYVLFIIIEFYF